MLKVKGPEGVRRWNNATEEGVWRAFIDSLDPDDMVWANEQYVAPMFTPCAIISDPVTRIEVMVVWDQGKDHDPIIHAHWLTKALT